MGILLAYDELMDIEEAVEDAVLNGRATDGPLTAVAKAQLKKDAYTLQTMAADGRCLEDIVKAMLKEAE